MVASKLFSDGYFNEALLAGAAPSDVAAAVLAKDRWHMVVRGDSLTLPRPIRYDDYSAQNPYLATRFVDTFPSLVARKLEAELSKPVSMTNTSHRGMRWDQFSLGVGRGLEELVTSFEADIFVAFWGYTEMWQNQDGHEGVDLVAEQYATVLNRLMDRMPALMAVVIALPLPGARVRERFRSRADAIARFNDLTESRLHPDIAHVALPNEPGVLHTDEQHLSTIGHSVLADHVFAAIMQRRAKLMALSAG